MLDGGAAALAAKRFDVATRQRVEEMLLAAFAGYRDKDGSYAILAARGEVALARVPRGWPAK
jgi:hypothetical protein